MISPTSLFDYAGFASLSDLQNEEWRLLFTRMESAQSQFIDKECNFRSPAYKWPHDSLHTWSRLWEYPYVYYHLTKAHGETHGESRLKVVDFGSGVTFFPFSVARLGCDVTCIDIDPICAQDIPKVSKVIESSPGSVQVELLNKGKSSLPDASQDVVYCISVLEHIPDFKHSIGEIARVLKPGGKLILTVDIDLRGNFELGVNDFLNMRETIASSFCQMTPDKVCHPADYLTTANSPCSTKSSSLFFWAKQLAKYTFGKYNLYGNLNVGVFLTVYGAVYRKI